MTLDDYPGAPIGASVTEEGWLVLGDEAWTRAEVQVHHPEWLHPRRRRRAGPRKYASDEERHAAKLQAKRDYRERQRQRERVGSTP